MPVQNDADDSAVPPRITRTRAERREDWYVIPAQFALRLVSQPDTSDAEPRMLLVHPDRLGLRDEPGRTSSRRTRGVK